MALIMLDGMQSIDLYTDLRKHHHHLCSQGIPRILPEEILREVSDLEPCGSLDRSLVFIVSTDDHLQECSLPCPILPDECDLVLTIDLKLGIEKEFRLFDILREIADSDEARSNT